MVGQIALARLMGPSAFGVLTLALTYVTVVLAVSDLGVGASASRFIALYLGAEKPDLVRSVALISGLFVVGLGILASATTLFLLDEISGLIGGPQVRDPLAKLAVFMPTVALGTWANAILKGLGRHGLQMLFESALLQPLMFFLGLVAWLSTEDISMVALADGVAYGFVGILSVLFVIHLLPQSTADVSDSRVFVPLLRHGLPLTFVRVGQRVLKRADNLLIGVFLTPADVGVYRVAFMAASGVQQTLSAVNSIALAAISKSHGREDKAGIMRDFEIAAWTGMSMVIPIYVPLLLFADLAIPSVLGSAYSGAEGALAILALGFASTAVGGPLGSAFNALGKNFAYAGIVLVTASFATVLLFLFIPVMGVSGAAIANAIGAISLAIISSWFLISQGLVSAQGATRRGMFFILFSGVVVLTLWGGLQSFSRGLTVALFEAASIFFILQFAKGFKTRDFSSN